tara:strand:- start:259 stop:1131 length:873 start_codon:yes stop_codon:yes gene_type:complete
MKINCMTEFGPLNSEPVFKAFIKSCQDAGDTVYTNRNDDCDVAVIWSVLWMGRMQDYRFIWNRYKKQNKPVVVIEVGGIKRNQTWKIGINGVNREADYALEDLDPNRWSKFNIELKPWRDGGENIILCGQHHRSHQWRNNPPIQKYFENQINEIRTHTDKHIVVRPHPRNSFIIDTNKFKNISLQYPIRDRATYDDTDFEKILKTAYAVVNYSSNPAMTAAFNGVPVFVSEASLCYDIGNLDFNTINNPRKPERHEWANRLAHTEWWIDEIREGTPWRRIKKRLEQKYLK